MNAQSLLGVLLLAASATPPLPTPHEVGRERITAAVVEKIRFEGELAAWSDAERTAFLEELGIDRMAATCVPKTALASSRAAADAVLRSCVTHLGYNDRELNRLAVEKALMDAVLILEQTRYLPRLDEQGRARLQQSVTETMDRAEGIVSAQLSDIIPREEIEKAGRHAVSDLLQRMNDVTSYQMKQAADAKELDRLLHVFEERLTISRERAVSLDTFASAGNVASQAA
jgi:hypothetical protein